MLRRFTGLKRRHQLGFGIFLSVGIISLWRGIWGLSDIYLFPDDKTLSYISSFIIGLGIIAATDYLIDRVV